MSGEEFDCVVEVARRVVVRSAEGEALTDDLLSGSGGEVRGGVDHPGQRVMTSDAQVTYPFRYQ